MSQQYIIYADSDKCRGCKKCELACIASHNGVTIKEAAKLRKDHEPRVHVVKTDTLKMPLRHGLPLWCNQQDLCGNHGR